MQHITLLTYIILSTARLKLGLHRRETSTLSPTLNFGLTWRFVQEPQKTIFYAVLNDERQNTVYISTASL